MAVSLEVGSEPVKVLTILSFIDPYVRQTGMCL